MLKVTSPLIVPIQHFNTFENYFLSLSKKCRNSLTLPKQKRLMEGLQYRQLGWDEDLIKSFMDLWETQSIHFGTPRWPDGWFEFMKDLHSRGNFDMFGMIKGTEVISVHFLFKFNDYVYCNSPLYNKEEYDKISLGRLMWYNLIKFSITTKYCNFLDLEGNNNGTTYREVIENKVPPGTPGDFGYKWFFIPEKLKNLDEEYNFYYDYKTDVVDNGTWKGLAKDVNRKNLFGGTPIEIQYQHHFYIRYFKREQELKLLVKQLLENGIDKTQITLLTTHKDLYFGYETYTLPNSGYHQGDADLIQKSLELSDSKKINHYLNAGVVIYSKSKFTQYLRMTETSKDIIHVSRGNDLLEDEDPVLGCENQEELATGMIISATSDGIDILKNCYYDNFSGLRFIDKTDSKEIYIANMQKYKSKNGRGRSFIRYSQDNPYLIPEEIERGTSPIDIEQYFYFRVWEQTNFRFVNLTDNYRGLYFKSDDTKKTQDWLVNRDAGLLRLNKYRKDIFPRMFNIIKDGKFNDEIGFNKELQMSDKIQVDNLLVVSHMDDETIFFGNWLFLNGKNTKVIVTCLPSTNEEKRSSFEKVMKYCNVPVYEMWNWEESLNGYTDYNKISNKIKDEVELNEYKQIVTHNAMGEYGHIQHQQLNEIMTEAHYEGLVEEFWVYDLNPLGLEYRGHNVNPKEEMLNMYPEQERNNTIEGMRKASSTWYDHNKPGKWGSKYVGGGNLIDFEGMKRIDATFKQKLNLGFIREIPGLNKNFSNKFSGEDVYATDEEEKFTDVYSSFTNDFLQTIKSYFSNDKTEWVDVLDEFDDFTGLTNENKDMYIVTTSKSAMALHKLNLPYVFIATLSEKIPIEVKSSASRIIYSTNNYEINQFNETIVDFTRHHDIVKYDIRAQIWKAFVMKKRHNTTTKENAFSFFQIEDDTNRETQGRLHMRLNNPDYEGWYFIEGLDIQSGDVLCNWKVNLSTINQIWIRAEMTEKVNERGLVLRFWKDPIQVTNGDGMHPEPHDHDWLPDWKVKKVKYPDFSLFVPRGYEWSKWQ